MDLTVLSDDELQELYDEAYTNLQHAAEHEPNSEWHEACFAGAMSLALEKFDREQRKTVTLH